MMEHASGDKRFKILEVHMKKFQFRHDALIEILHKAQELFGYLEDDLLLFIAYKLKAARPQAGRNLLPFAARCGRAYVRCLHGHRLRVNGAEKVIAAVQNKFKVKPGETSACRFRC